MLVISMIGIVVGFVLLLLSFGFLLYGIWLRYRPEPSPRDASPESAPDGRPGAAKR